MIIQFAKENEKFDGTLSHFLFLLQDNWSSLCLSDRQNSGISAFGKVIAVPGRKYHWKLKIMTNTDKLSIGVVENKLILGEQSDGSHNENYWLHKNGYLYRSDGNKYGKSNGAKYSNAYGRKGDIIDVYLDLRDGVHLSFGKNGIKYGKAYGKKSGTSRLFMMEDGVSYRLAISAQNPCGIQLLSLVES